MKTYLLIGGMGSGKSTVASLLAQRGACCIDTDLVGHRVLLQPAVRDALREAFGESVLDAEGEINRAALAAQAFVSADATARLNQITHPAILADTRSCLQEAQAEGTFPVAVVETSAYDASVDVGGLGEVAGIIAVVAPEELRVQRAVAKGFDEAEVRCRIARQPSDEQRRRWATHIVENDGSFAELRTQVDALWEALLASPTPYSIH